MTDPRHPEHMTDGRACWCGPRLLAPCADCDDRPDADPDCWRCGGRGLVEAGPWDAGAVIVVHEDRGIPRPSASRRNGDD